MIRHLATVDPRRVPVFAASLVLLVAAALALYVVVPQWKLLRAAAAERAALEQAADAGKTLVTERAALQQEVNALAQRLEAGDNRLSQDALESLVLGRVQELTAQSGVELVSIEPAAGVRIDSVQEAVFEIELVGEYGDLLVWLRRLRTDLEAVVVRQLLLMPLDANPAAPRLHAVLRAAAYRSSE